MKTVIDIENVNQSFRTGFWLKETPVLHDLTLSVSERSVFGFLGANGAGKTTLIHLIAGLRKPKSGSIRVFGHEAHTLEAKSQTGYLPERPYFYEHLTGEGLLEYFGSLAGGGLSRNDIRARIPKVLETVGMAHARKVELRNYSKGMLQRIGIAQALIHDPKLLILDEPMSGLDPHGRKEMRDLMSRLASEGKTLFFSTHIIPDVETLCDQIAVIEKGRIKAAGPIQQFLSKDSTLTSLEASLDGFFSQQSKG